MGKTTVLHVCANGRPTARKAHKKLTYGQKMQKLHKGTFPVNGHLPSNHVVLEQRFSVAHPATRTPTNATQSAIQKSTAWLPLFSSLYTLHKVGGTEAMATMMLRLISGSVTLTHIGNYTILRLRK